MWASVVGQMLGSGVSNWAARIGLLECGLELEWEARAGATGPDGSGLDQVRTGGAGRCWADLADWVEDGAPGRLDWIFGNGPTGFGLSIHGLQLLNPQLS